MDTAGRDRGPLARRSHQTLSVEPEHEARFARFFEAAQEGFYIGVLEADGSTTLAANARLRLVLGCPPEMAANQVRPFDTNRFADAAARRAFLERLRLGGAVSDYLLRLIRLDGATAWVEVTACAEPMPEGDGLRVEAVIKDVGERRRLDHQSRDLQTELLQAEKMAALGHTISGVAHELNNPLATILSWAERLSDRSVDEQTRRGLAVILGESERAARIVRNLLTFARKRQSTRSLVDVNQVVRETLALRAYEQRVSNIQRIDALASGLPPVFADGHQIKQILLNLVINAEQAMLTSHGRGTLVVRTWHDDQRGSVLLEISDDGPGVPPDVQQRIFDPFFTTKEVGHGTGLGLSVAYALVKEHGGRITLRPGEPGGAAFIVELPVLARAAEPAPAAGKSVAPPSLAAVKGARVLVVEDEPALAIAVAEALGDAGLVVDRAGDGEEGLSRLAEQSYELIVCDLKMPRIDGMQFYRAMAAATPALARRVIFVTGDVAGTDAERFLEETGCRWLSKPFRLGDLLRAARDTLS
ncbi:MAG TPA: ATP-binding protein [Vicinamibacterales bacterium]|nr:ATP-binding protein [Vicinamibacterales bacterium]